MIRFRYWWRLIGRRYDIQSWAPDRRNCKDIKGSLNPKYTRAFPKGIKASEKWISDIPESQESADKK